VTSPTITQETINIKDSDETRLDGGFTIHTRVWLRHPHTRELEYWNWITSDLLASLVQRGFERVMVDGRLKVVQS